MPRIRPLEPAAATGKSRELLDAAAKKLGRVPNLLKSLAHSAAALESYLALKEILAQGTLAAPVREQLALAVGEANGCDYCLAAHSALGKMAGLKPDEITAARRGRAADPTAAAALRFAQQVLEKKGFVSDEELAAARAAGLSDGQISEVVAHVALNVYTNYFNHVAGTEVDFPKAAAL